jgi:serine-type D-Ala-D-Ala carboxypeptidase/endopeptidase (penicillin-binding protein 4)
VKIRTAVQEPADWYRRALVQALQRAGIAIEGGPAVGADRLVHEHRSGLQPALQRMLEDSSNFDAEQCLRVLGQQQLGDGSLAGGVKALDRFVASFAGSVPNLELHDGSGLSKQNRLSPAVLVMALAAASHGEAGALLRASLPVAGRSGTLADRFVGTDLVGRVQAKTGWIRGASALSGFFLGKDGKLRLFAILMNYDPKKDGLNKDLKRCQEQIVAAIEALEPTR